MRLKNVLLIILLFCMLLPSSALAQQTNYVELAIQALQNDIVYVAPGTEHTNTFTADDLKQSLLPTDNIVLVMLPGDALIGTDMQSLVTAISEGLNNEKIIGLAVGREVIGYAPSSLCDSAEDLMVNASSISNSAKTTLSVFARNIHLWQMHNSNYVPPTSTPEPTPTPEATPTPKPTPKPMSAETKKALGKGALIVLGGVILIFLVVTVKNVAPTLTKKARALRRRQYELARIEEDLQKVVDLVNRLRETRLKKELVEACSLARQLLRIMKGSETPIGDVEAALPALLSYMQLQVNALVNHESGLRTLNSEIYDQLVEVLQNYDNLFNSFKNKAPDVQDILESIIFSTNRMIEVLGHLPDQQK